MFQNNQRALYDEIGRKEKSEQEPPNAKFLKHAKFWRSGGVS